jgi:flagellar basal-body rod protein FlgC
MNTDPMHGIFHGFDIIGAGLRAEMQRAEVISVNLSHLQDVGNEDDPPYMRRSVVFEEVLEDHQNSPLGHLPGGKDLPRGVQVKEIYTDTETRSESRFDPTHPKANAKGYVLMSNVNMFKEMVDLRSVQRSFQANLVALRTYREMIQASVENIGR